MEPSSSETHPPLASLLGPTLLRADGIEIATADAFGPDGALSSCQFLAIYFGATWCIPCRKFAPLFKGFVERNLDKGIKVVFASSDQDENSQFDYLRKHMPDSTLAAPLETVPALDRRFHVSGIPTVVLLDGQTGEVIVKDCVTNVIRDPEGRQFPWRTKTVWETLEGEDIVKKDDEGNWFPVNKAELQDKELVFLLFAAEWAPPCRAFTSHLSPFLDELPDAPPVLLIPSDTEKEGYARHLAAMPTGSYSLGFARPVEAELAETLGIDDIPSLVLLKNGKLHLRDAEGKILSHPQDYPWPTISMVEAFAEEDMAVCILFDERSGPAEIEAFVALATERMGSDWKFVRIAKEPGDLTRETDPSEAAEAPDTDASKEEEFHAVRSVLSFLTRQYSHALANSTKVVAIAGDRRHAWAFGWDGGNPGEAEITKEGLANWLDSIDAGKAVAVPARSLSETSDSYEEDEDDSDWEEEDTEEYDSEAEGDMQELHAQLEMLMAQMGGASGDREQQLRGLLSMLSPGSMGGAGGAGIEELLSGMRAANIAEVDEEDIGEEEWADEEEGPGRGGSSESEEGGRQPEALGSGKGKERAIE